MEKLFNNFRTLINTLYTKDYLDTVSQIILPRYGSVNKDRENPDELWVKGKKDSKELMYLVGIKKQNYENPKVIVKMNVSQEVQNEINYGLHKKYDVN